MAETRRARREELAQVGSLLESHSLPPLPRDLSLSNVLVALDGDAVVGSVVLKVVARRGLLRAVVVSPSHRGKGIGGSLIRSIVARAHELGLRDLYLLTEGAAPFFAELGFGPIERSQVPLELAMTREYREQCRESAIVMHLPLASRF